MARVLLIHATRPGATLPTPHLGCALLAAVLGEQGHTVRVLDFALLTPEERAWEEIATFAEGFRPELIGLSIYTASSSFALDLARRLKERLGVPIVVGGAHATLYPERVATQPFVDTVVCGEAEGVIGAVAADPAAFAGQVVQGRPADVSQVPFPDFTALHHSERLRIYPLLLSRGCPFACSFCPVHRVAGRRWRPRPVEQGTEELRAALHTYPGIERVEVHDDCPTVNVPRFKEFLRAFPELAPGIACHVANMRADTVDEELIALLKGAGANAGCIAVEHGNPDVFAAIHKAETLADIERAAGIIRAAGLGLQLCFVIGLPGDSLKRTRDSTRLAKRLGAYLVYWNMAHPFPGTAMRRWFEENGATFYPDDDYCSYSEPSLECQDPVVETPDFTREQRKAARFLAALETDQYTLRDGGWQTLLRLTRRYGFYGSAVRSLARGRLGKLRHVVRSVLRPG